MKQNKITLMKHLYNKAKKTKTGETITCPYCKRKHTKTTYHKIFCSNQKTKVRRNCKDMFWNNIDPNKKCRKTDYFYSVILETFAKERGFPDYETMQVDEDLEDGSWDAGGLVELAICDLCHLRSDYCRCGEADAMLYQEK